MYPLGVNVSLGVNLTYPGGKVNDAVVHFSTALVSKQKAGGKFYVRKLARGKWEKKVENPCFRITTPCSNFHKQQFSE